MFLGRGNRSADLILPAKKPGCVPFLSAVDDISFTRSKFWFFALKTGFGVFVVRNSLFFDTPKPILVLEHQILAPNS